MNIKDEIKKIALEDTSIECCGCVYKVSGKKYVHKCKNFSTNPQSHFIMSPFDYLKCSISGKIEYIFHSHNSEKCEFSEFDKVQLYNHKIRGILYNTKMDTLKIFYPESFNNPYIGKAFEFNKSDCYTLVREYYKDKFNIHLPDFNRSSKWSESININDEFLKQNLLTENDKLEKGNIIVFQFSKHPDHFGIYLENNLFLHHPRNRFSIIDEIANGYEKRIFKILKPHEAK